MRRGSGFITWYLLIVGAMAVIACLPGGTLMALLITAMALPLFGIPGFLIAASPTILIYSTSLLPLWLALTDLQRRIWLIAVTALIPAVVAVGPGLFARHSADAFAARMDARDFARPSPLKPKSIELAGDMTSGLYVYGQTVGDKFASCNDVCRRLLFGGEVERVRMIRIPDIYMNKRGGTTHSATYRLEHRDSCPQLYPDGTSIEKAVRDRLLAGDCIVQDDSDTSKADAAATLLTTYSVHHYPSKPAAGGPDSIESVKELSIAARDEAGGLSPFVLRNQTTALIAALPFYIGAEMHMQGGYNGPVLGRVTRVIHPIDLMQVLRDTFGFKLAAIEAPPPQAAKELTERILALPRDTTPVLSAQQQDVINDRLTEIARQPTPSDADVDFLRRVIGDDRIGEAKLGIALQNMFRKFTVRLAPLIPVMVERLKAPVPERIGHYKSMLGWSLASFPADSLKPYSAALVAIVAAQPDWPSNGVLTRLAELGNDDATKLVIDRLDSKSQRQFAAVAACRASPDVWPALERAVLAHLSPPPPGDHLRDDERPLLLALVRFGKKDVAVDLIEKRGLFNKKRTLDLLAKHEPGFAPEHCRDPL
ncbi:MAG TPA: hypothetical protein VG986_15570, partial [Pseudolabrys sp.]|nr:hypothetical protein [Pseudolabrys sp.]